MNFMLAQYSAKHDDIERVVEALKQYIRAVRENEPERLVEVYQVPYSNQFYHLLSYEDEEDQKRHRQMPYMQKLVDSLRGVLTADMDFVELNLIGTSR